MTDPNQYVTVVNPYDVLFGRGSGPNDHEGNIRFRDLVSQRKAEYMATNHRQTKAKIAKEIVDTVFSNNGRFLKKLEASEVQHLGFADGMDVYAIVDDATIMEKAKQALRQNRDKNANIATAASNVTSTATGGGVGKDALNMSMGMPPPPLPRTSVSSMQFQGSLPQLDGGMLNPMLVNSFEDDQRPIYKEDAEGYATYTTTLEDPEDDRLFPNRRQSSNMAGGGPRRGSLLGGRKDGSGPRRGSTEMSEQWRRDTMMGGRGESMQMSELMESFKGMSTGEINSSTDTIGTIEGDVYGKNQMSGLSNMSVMSMSSTTSLFKGGAETDLSGGAVSMNPSEGGGVSMGWPTRQQQIPQQQFQQQQAGMANHRASMIPKDAWNSGQLNNLLRAPIDGSSTLLTLDGSSIPRSMEAMESNPDSLNFLTASMSTADSQNIVSSGSAPTNAGNGSTGMGIFDSNKGSGRILPP